MNSEDYIKYGTSINYLITFYTWKTKHKVNIKSKQTTGSYLIWSGYLQKARLSQRKRSCLCAIVGQAKMGNTGYTILQWYSLLPCVTTVTYWRTELLLLFSRNGLERANFLFSKIQTMWRRWGTPPRLDICSNKRKSSWSLDVYHSTDGHIY